MKYLAHNFNNSVKVVLNDLGHEVLRKHYSKLSNRDLVIEIDDEGYTKFQTYELMNIFGPYTTLGKRMPFDTRVLIEVSEE